MVVVENTDNWDDDYPPFGDYEDTPPPIYKIAENPPVIALDVDGVLHPLVTSVDDFRELMEEMEHIREDFDGLPEKRKEELRHHARVGLNALRAWGFGGASTAEKFEEQVEKRARTPQYELPRNVTLEAMLTSLSDHEIAFARKDWHEGPFHKTWESSFKNHPDYIAGERDSISTNFVIVNWIGAWVKFLQKRGVTVAWSTTWGPSANRYFSDLMEIGELPVPTDGRVRQRFSEDAFSWKRHSFAEYFGFNEDSYDFKAPTVFIDDMAPNSYGEVNSLTVATDPTFGLLPSQAQKVEDWLASRYDDFSPISVEGLIRDFQKN